MMQIIPRPIMLIYASMISGGRKMIRGLSDLLTRPYSPTENPRNLRVEGAFSVAFESIDEGHFVFCTYLGEVI